MRIWDAYVRREGAQPRTRQRPRGTGASGARGLEPRPHGGEGPPQPEAGLNAACSSPKFWTLAVFGDLLRGIEQLVVALGNLLDLAEPERLRL